MRALNGLADRSKAKNTRLNELAAELKIAPNTITGWLLRYKQNPHAEFHSSGRPEKTASAEELLETLATLNERQKSLRSNELPILHASAQAKARGRGQPSHTVTVSARTVSRRKKKFLELNASECQAQGKTEVRVDSEDSARNMTASFGSNVSTSRDAHPALIFNTDATVFAYNFDPIKSALRRLFVCFLSCDHVAGVFGISAQACVPRLLRVVIACPLYGARVCVCGQGCQSLILPGEKCILGESAEGHEQEGGDTIWRAAAAPASTTFCRGFCECAGRVWSCDYAEARQGLGG